MRADILALVYSAIDEVDPMTADGAALAKSPDARLLGSDSGVDSLTFVNLVVALEEQIQTKLGKSVVLVDEDNMAADEHPFRTIGTLAEYVERVLNKP
jgi:D-alanine--poly(phosphoribitol) ligase subunit 2